MRAADLPTRTAGRYGRGPKSPSRSVASPWRSASGPFTVSVWARSPSPYLDLESLIGKPGSFSVQSGLAYALRPTRRWNGVVSFIEQVQAEPTGLSTYHLRIAPTIWLLSHRQNHRVFQHKSIPDIVDQILGEWEVPHAWEIQRDSYPKLEFKVQYGESDYTFLCRLLEEAGIAFCFPDDGGGSQLLLSDALHAGPPLPFVDSPNEEAEMEFATQLRLAHEVRPGAHLIRDYDFRNPSFPPPATWALGRRLGEDRRALLRRGLGGLTRHLRRRASHVLVHDQAVIAEQVFASPGAPHRHGFMISSTYA
ncbi:hypothetical protein A7982_13338 [Minicystis rosea]|nr:hypothetical protein A7982_13338 [Minicystis rosea]